MTCPVMIFAAGLGTRMGALTRDCPKPLLRAGGRTLLDHALVLARDVGAGPVVVNAHAHAEQIAAHLEAQAPDVRISFERDRLETGGGLRRALPLLGASPVLTLNADAVWTGPNPLRLLQASWDPGRMDALLCLVPRKAALAHGGPGDFFLAPDGRLSRRGASSEAPFVFAGAQILHAEPLASGPEGPFSLNVVWDRLLEARRLFGIVHPGPWVDVGKPEGLAAAETLLAAAGA